MQPNEYYKLSNKYKYVHIIKFGGKKVEELVEKAKNNDKIAFSELIIAIKKELYLIAKTKLKNDDDIGDAIQETIYKSYKNIKKLRDNSIFRKWIIKILINECNNIYKKKRIYSISYEENEMEKYLVANDDSENIEFELLIKDLDNEEKLILTLYYCSKYTIKEISKIAKIKENTIKSKMARARNKIRKQFEEEEENV